MKHLISLATVVSLLVSHIAAMATIPSEKVSYHSIIGGEEDKSTNHKSYSLEKVVRYEGADWIRLEFGQETDSPLIRISSLKDGSTQHLTPETIKQWQYTSAYFNGDAVLVESFSQDGLVDDHKVVIKGLTIGTRDRSTIEEPIAQNQNKSLCGADSRELSNYNRSGRFLAGGGCTAWLINDRNHCFLSANHCGTDSTGGGVVEFHVPLSVATPLGHQIVHPPPEHQYPVDPSSMIRPSGDTGPGNDWMYFGCFPNTETGLTAYEAQQDQYILSTNFVAPEEGADIRIMGYGVVEFDKPKEWNQVQKVAYGPFSHDKQENGNKWSVYYTVDTTGGDSGSGIEQGNVAIGIHTHGGCSRVFGGLNYGTFIGNVNL